MKLYLIPSPKMITYLGGFTKNSVPVLKIEDKTIKNEAFELFIDENITIKASSPSGFFYAEGALEQIKFQCGVNLPKVVIRDEPKYSYRSFMVDCARHFFSVKEIKEMIDICAKLRFNVFHWHLTDDQGWRIESEKYPELVRLGSVRQGDNFGPLKHSRTYAAYYSKKQIKDIISYAHQRHMRVLPEIDMPGHVSAMLKAIPHLSCKGEEVMVKNRQGIFKDVICAGKDSSYETLFSILDEICDLFPDEYIHIGGDEVPKDSWQSCPHCQAKINAEGLHSEEELQGYFMNTVASYLKQKGKSVITWNESLKSGMLKNDIIVQMWMDRQKLSAKCNNQVIVSDFYHYYADYPYEMTPLKKTYDYNPHISGNVIGVDTPIWTEFVDSFKYMQFMCFPRFIAVAESAWSIFKLPYKEFKTQIFELYPFFGITHGAKENQVDPPIYSRGHKMIKYSKEHFIK